VPVYIWSVVLLGTATCVATVALVPARATGERELSGWLLALMFFATASYVANFPYGRHVHAFQLCDVPRLLGLLFASPATLIVARLLGALPALVLVRRQVDRKLLFNLGSFALEVSTAILVFAALAPETAGIGPSMWPALFAATAAADLVSSVSVGLAIALSEGERLRDRLIGPARIAILTSFAASILGLTVATTYYYSPGAAALLAVLVVLAMVASRSFGEVAERNQAAVRLQTLLSELGPVTVDAPQLPRLLGMVRELFGVECVHLVRHRADGQQVRTVCADGVVVVDRRLDEAEATLLSQVMESGQASADAPLRRFRLPSQRAKRLVAPLPGRQGALGGLVLSEPLGDVRQFSALDLRLLSSVSTQLGQAVERGEELCRLEWAASHDPTTGLLNLQAWRTQLAERLELSPHQLVMSIDIARLRVINDVFGRATGDLMLVALADRLQAGRAGGLAGRVGGHHFALLAPPSPGSSPADAAREIRNALQQPIDLHGLSLQLGVRIGVAVTPEHGHDPEVLLRRAEAALDAAKSDTSDLAVFTPDMEGDSKRSLRLLSDLRTALSGGDGGGELRLVYQPKVDLGTRRMYGVEALIRWDHPTLGLVPPDEFVPVAEETGLINPLTDWVLQRALSDCVGWRRAGHPTTVAVNLSALSLLDPELSRRVQTALDVAGLPPEALVLELTETSVMARPEHSIVVLQGLHDLGVALSIDDFGTGYSSLAYLRQLPVDEVKLDRSFLAPLSGASQREAGKAESLVRDTIRLSHSLDLHVLVEGVEDQRTLDKLVDLEADAVQGYFTGRPVATAELHRSSG
jgi:diguanylate cyclase (GGDEF)-like protein